MSFNIPPHLMVEGIRELDMTAIANQSQLLIPPEFDKKKFVGKWAFVGASADKARMPQRLLDKYMIDGWEPFKYPKGHAEADKLCIRPLGDKQAILMYRPRVLQNAVNAIYGNASRERTIAEQKGQTAAGQPVPAGLLAHQQLLAVEPVSDAEQPVGYQFNKIPAMTPATMGGRGVSRKRKSS